jgi:hypothetical protein
VKQVVLSPGALSLVMSVQAAEVLTTFFCSLAFIALYTVVAPWWRNPLGRNLVAFDASLSLTLLPSVIHHTFGPSAASSAFFGWFTVVAFAMVPCVIIWRAVIMVRMQRAHLHDPPPVEPQR